MKNLDIPKLPTIPKLGLTLMLSILCVGCERGINPDSHKLVQFGEYPPVVVPGKNINIDVTRMGQSYGYLINNQKITDLSKEACDVLGFESKGGHLNTILGFNVELLFSTNLESVDTGGFRKINYTNGLDISSEEFYRNHFRTIILFKKGQKLRIPKLDNQIVVLESGSILEVDELGEQAIIIRKKGSSLEIKQNKGTIVSEK